MDDDEEVSHGQRPVGCKPQVSEAALGARWVGFCCPGWAEAALTGPGEPLHICVTQEVFLVQRECLERFPVKCQIASF